MLLRDGAVVCFWLLKGMDSVVGVIFGLALLNSMALVEEVLGFAMPVLEALKRLSIVLYN